MQLMLVMQEISILLAYLGHKLASLTLYDCDLLFTSRTFGTLWALTRLESLSLINWSTWISMNHFERGMQHLR